MSQSHTIVVTSNVADERNHSNHFYNRLGTPLDFSQGQWQVAIKKMIYLNSFLNIINESMTLTTKPTEKIIKLSLQRHNIKKGVPHPITDDGKVYITPFERGFAADGPPRFCGLTINIDYDRPLVVGGLGEISCAVVEEYEDGTSKARIEYAPLSNDYESKYVVQWDRYQVKPVISATVICKIRKISSFSIPPGNYEKLSELLDALNALGVPGTSFTISKGLVHIGMKDPAEELRLNNQLDITLGFPNRKLTQSTTASYLPQLNRGRFAFFIYSNLVNPIRVGDMEAPLMDVISIPKREYGEIISLDVVNPLYSALARKQINEIEIMLATDSGEPITFDNRSGNAKTLMVLHFQRVL